MTRDRYIQPAVAVVTTALESAVMGFSQGSEIITPSSIDYYDTDEL